MRIALPIRRGAVYLAVLALLPAALLAQADGDPVLKINLSGAAGARVAAATGGARMPLGRVSPGAPLTLDMAALNAGKGKRITVRVDNTGGEPVVLLVPPGVGDPACDQVPDDDGCPVLGLIPGGTSSVIGLNSVAGVLNLSGGIRRPRFTLGVDYTSTGFTNLDKVACDMSAIAGLTGCGVDDWGTGVGVFGEYRLLPQVDFGFRYSRSSYRVDQMYGQDPLTHDVTVTMYDAYTRIRPLGEGRISPFLLFGGSRFCNDSDILRLDQVLGNRGQGGFRFVGGGGLDLRLTDSFGARAGATLATGGGGDADGQLRYSLGATLTF